VKLYNSGIKHFTNEMFKEIIAGDIMVLAFPLFADAIPSNTLKMLIELENIIKQEERVDLIMYTIVNNGFFEGKQNHVAFEIIKHWCEHSGVQFGGGIGQGAGEMIGQTTYIPFNKGPYYNLARALNGMVKNMESKKPFEIKYLSPYFPKFMWKFLATRYWLTSAKKNGITKKDMFLRR
jgi:hypothetical protein